MLNVFTFGTDLGRRAFVALKNLKGDKKGVTALEYGILAGAVATAIVIAVGTYTTSVQTFFTALSGTIAALPH